MAFSLCRSLPFCIKYSGIFANRFMSSVMASLKVPFFQPMLFWSFHFLLHIQATISVFVFHMMNISFECIPHCDRLIQSYTEVCCAVCCIQFGFLKIRHYICVFISMFMDIQFFLRLDITYMYVCLQVHGFKAF